MARTKNQPVAIADLPVLDGEMLTANQNVMANLQASHGDERDLLNQLLGQAQMAESLAKFSLTVSTSKLAYVKETKLYRGLSGKKTADGQQFNGTWDEFCSLLGRSRQQVDEDIANLRTLKARDEVAADAGYAAGKSAQLHQAVNHSPRARLTAGV